MTQETIGEILSNPDTMSAEMQLRKEYEEEPARFAGSLVVIERTDGDKLLAEIEEIVPYNSFYESENVWSQTRREGESDKLPKEAATKSVVCRLNLQRNLDQNRSVSIPPSPGDLVKTIDASNARENLFNISDETPCFDLGSLRGYAKGENQIKVPYNVNKLPMHLGIFGVTGSGKSYTTGALIERLMKLDGGGSKFSYPMIMVDAHGDYQDYIDRFIEEQDADEEELDEEIFRYVSEVRRIVMPEVYSDLSRKQKRVSKKFALDLNQFQVDELARLIIMFYKQGDAPDEVWVTRLSEALEYLKGKYGGSDAADFNRFFEDGGEEIKERLDDMDDLNYSRQQAIEKSINIFYQNIEHDLGLISAFSDPEAYSFSDKEVREIVSSPELVFLDFGDGAPNVDNNKKQVIIAAIATQLLSQFKNMGKDGSKEGSPYLLFGIEESQNYCPSSTYHIGANLTKKKMRDIATQGRKFGLSLCMITQRPAFVDKIVLSQLNSYMIHKAAPSDVGQIKKSVGRLGKRDVQRLTSLSRGEVIMAGVMNFLPEPAKLQINKDDRTVDHEAGETKVAEELSSYQE